MLSVVVIPAEIVESDLCSTLARRIVQAEEHVRH